MRAFILGWSLLVLWGSACGRDAVLCGPGNCPGCCDGRGLCQEGDAPSACGKGGSVCSSCESGQSCRIGVCAVGGSAGGAASMLPEVIVLLDVSGTMTTPLDSSQPACRSCVGTTCPPQCQTRISEVRSALSGFLMAHGLDARMGLATFPATGDFTPPGCRPATTMDVPLLEATVPDDRQRLEAQRNLISMFVSGLGQTRVVTGGSPTSASLVAMGGHFRSPGRRRAVILVTDGLPNCNPNNPLHCNSTPRPDPSLCTLGPLNCTGAFCRAGYVDQAAAVQAVQGLAVSGVRTAVVVVDPAPPMDLVGAMNALAESGGAACTSCSQRFYAGSSGNELALALTAAFRKAVAP